MTVDEIEIGGVGGLSINYKMIGSTTTLKHTILSLFRGTSSV
jgi:hypothetical protein